MSATKIEWADRVWNPVTGCTKCSPACDNCYAERMSKRLAGRFGYPADEPFRVTLHEDKLFEPRFWANPARIFVGSMTDLFHPDVPFAWLDQIFATMGQCKRHTFLLLTKRPERMQEYLLQGCEWRLPNVWLGTTIWDQASADRAVPILLSTPAAKRFVSVEPMLGPVELGPRFRKSLSWSNYSALDALNWVICGGETGPGARPMHPDWPRSLRDQCQAAGVPFFFKQWGEWSGILQRSLETRIVPKADGSRSGWKMFRVGKKRAGRVLDGRTWEEVPNA